MTLQKDITLLRLFNFFEDFRPYGAIAILYFADITGSWALGLSVFSVVRISQSLFEVPTGVFSDIIGRKKTMLLGSACNFLGIICYALAQDVNMLVVGAVFQGLSSSLFSGNQEALLHDILFTNGEEAMFAHHHGRLRAMFQVGLGTAAILGGFIGEYSLRWVLWTSAVPPIISMMITIFMTSPPNHASEEANVFAHLKEAMMKFRNNWRLRTLSLSSIFSYGVGDAMYQFEPAFVAMIWPTWALGLSRSGNHFFAAISCWYAGSIIKKYTDKIVLLSTNIFSRIAGLLVFTFPTMLSPVILSLMSLTYGPSSVALDALLQKEFTHKQRATMGSLNAFAGSILFAIIAFALGKLADISSPREALIAGEIVLLPVIYWYWKLFTQATSLQKQQQQS